MSVTLDGETLRDVVTADEELGLVVQYVRDADGRMTVDSGEAVRRELFGKVRVRGVKR